jgi:hypothetical protein
MENQVDLYSLFEYVPAAATLCLADFLASSEALVTEEVDVDMVRHQQSPRARRTMTV